MSLVKIRAALENALDTLVPGVIPAASIASSVAGSVVTFNTTAPHGLESGLVVGISGHSVSALNGEYTVAVISDTSFTLAHPITGAPIASAAGGAGGVVRAKLTAWEGTHFKPLAGVPYQRAFILPAMTENPAYGVERETGIFQLMLNYPDGEGTFDVTTRAEIIRSVFSRGSSFAADGVVVRILKTPSILGGHPVDAYFVVPVIINYQADILT